MKKISPAAIAIVFFGLLVSSCATTNPPSSTVGKISSNDLKEFSQNIRKVYIWTYITGNKEYIYNKDALKSIEEKLQNLGYSTERVWYYPEDGEPVNDWRKSKINSLGQNEAFVEVTYSSYSYNLEKTIPGERNVGTVRDSYGRPVYNVYEKTSTTRTKTKSSSTANLQLCFNTDSKGLITYNRSNTLKISSLTSVVNMVLSTIPRKK